VLKRILQGYLRTKGYEIAKSVDTTGKTISVLELLVEKYARQEELFVLQIGANDGLRDDPIRDLIIKYSLSGLLVEPIAEYYQKLTQNYGEQQHILTENCAVSWKDGTQPLYYVTRTHSIPDWAYGMASFDRNVIAKHKNQIQNIENYIEVMEVPTLSVKTLLAKHGISSAGLLQIDTEGYDFEIIKMCFASGLSPRLINYEYVHLSLSDQKLCRQFLEERKYRFLNIGKDTLAVRDD